MTSVNQLESQVLGELNTVRRKHGLPPLRRSEPSAAADAALPRDGQVWLLQPRSRDGSEFSTRVKRWYGPPAIAAGPWRESPLVDRPAQCGRGGQAVDGQPGAPQEHPHAELARVDCPRSPCPRRRRLRGRDVVIITTDSASEPSRRGVTLSASAVAQWDRAIDFYPLVAGSSPAGRTSRPSARLGRGAPQPSRRPLECSRTSSERTSAAAALREARGVAGLERDRVATLPRKRCAGTELRCRRCTGSRDQRRESGRVARRGWGASDRQDRQVL